MADRLQVETLPLISHRLANLVLDNDTTLPTIWHESTNATNFLLNEEALHLFCTKLDENSSRLREAQNSEAFNLANPAVQQYQKIEQGYTDGRESLHAFLCQLEFDYRNGKANIDQQLQTAILMWKNKLDGFLIKWKKDVEELSKHGAGAIPSSSQNQHADRSVSQQSHGRANSSFDNGRWSNSTMRASTSLSGLLRKSNNATLQSLLAAYHDKTLSPEDLIEAFGKSAIIHEDPGELYAAEDVPAPPRNTSDQMPIDVHHSSVPVLDNSRGGTLSSPSALNEGLAGAQHNARHPAADSQLTLTSGQGAPNSPSAPAAPAAQESFIDWLIGKAFKTNAVVAMGVFITGGTAALVAVAAVLPSEGSGRWENLELSSKKPFALAINTLFASGSLYALQFEIVGPGKTPKSRNKARRPFCVRQCARISFLGFFCTLSIISVICCWVLWGMALHTGAKVFKALGILDEASKLFFFLTLIYFVLKLIKLEAKMKAGAVQEDQELASLAHNRAPIGTSDADNGLSVKIGRFQLDKSM